jgi:hypothetical protein
MIEEVFFDTKACPRHQRRRLKLSGKPAQVKRAIVFRAQSMGREESDGVQTGDATNGVAGLPETIRVAGVREARGGI